MNHRDDHDKPLSGILAEVFSRDRLSRRAAVQ
jgi:hypothetical protein